MLDTLRELSKKALEELASLDNSKDLEQWRVTYQGKKSEFAQSRKQVGKLPPEERKTFGQVVNALTGELEQAFQARKAAIAAAEQEATLRRQSVDVTLPGKPRPVGSRHPIAKLMEEIEEVFQGLGFQIASGPEIETDEYAFELLNIPQDHPARDMWDTFWLKNGQLLRPHTSPVQIRAMQQVTPNPLKIICPGRVFRYENVTARSECQFHQVEGLEVGKNVTMGDLVAVLQIFAKELFGDERRIRLRNSYFPFTEPSLEVDMDCFNCGGKGCHLCKHTGWIEILGAGMVNPVVLRNCGYDPEVYSGYAFGMGVERIAMLKYKITDIRYFYRNDLRFLSQFQSA